MRTIKVLLISYRYTDKTVSAGSLGKKLKDYYETNSRGKLTIILTSVSYKVPFSSKLFAKAVKYVKNIMPKGYNVNVHFCNPGTSHTGGGNVITYASATNTIHEFGHALGLSHANSNLSGAKLMGSRDPFDQMTIFAPYPSTNAVHRDQMNWFFDGELVDNAVAGDYKLAMLKNFEDKTNIKVLLYHIALDDKVRPFYISYGTNKANTFITLHTIYGKNSSVLLGMYQVIVGKVYSNATSGLIIKINSEMNGVVDITVSFTNAQPMMMSLEADIEHAEHNEGEDCVCESMREDEDDAVDLQ